MPIGLEPDGTASIQRSQLARRVGIGRAGRKTPVDEFDDPNTCPVTCRVVLVDLVPQLEQQLATFARGAARIVPKRFQTCRQLGERLVHTIAMSRRRENGAPLEALLEQM